VRTVMWEGRPARGGPIPIASRRQKKETRMDYRSFQELIRNLLALADKEGEAVCRTRLQAELDSIANFRAGLSPEQDAREMDEFRRLCLPLLLQSEFGNYVFTKPTGYAGDYVTQEMIWLGCTHGVESRYRGSSKLGKLLTALTFDMAAPRANEARILRLRREVGNDYGRVASIGSGSCIEMWLPRNHTPAHVFLLDQDADALDRAREKTGLADAQCVYCRQNILKFILRNGKSSSLPSTDFVYAFGLLDYFSLPTARQIVAGLWPSVAPGGLLLVTNAHPDNPSKLWMEWVGDWWLNYKTPEELRLLSSDLPDLETTNIETDEFGVYQYMQLRKSR
ncbi:MAG: class I SAM-dependent methyltransferase, partial [bacterium]